jgi:hypothetical protein
VSEEKLGFFSSGANHNEQSTEPMKNFDELTKRLAQSVTRRAALKQFAAGTSASSGPRQISHKN